MAELSTDAKYHIVVDVMSNFTDVKKDQIKFDSEISVDLGLTSFDMVLLIASLEEKFNIDVSDSLTKKMKTVGDIVMELGKY